MSADDPEIAAAARSELRRWMAADKDAVRSRITRLGYDVVAAAAATTARLDAVTGDEAAVVSVAELRRLVEDVHAPAPRRRLGILVPPPPLERRLADAAPLITAGLGRLAEEAERLARRLAVARATDRRLADAAAALDTLAARLVALARATDAAARELRRDDPDRFAFLRDEVSPLLAERLGDVRSQQMVIDQGRLSLKLLIEAGDVLQSAIDRARHQTVPALRTAVAAVRALDEAAASRASATALGTSSARETVAAGVCAMRDALGVSDD